MKILAIEEERPAVAAEDFISLLEDEARSVWEFQQSGVIRELYFRRDRREAVLLLECAGTEEAARVLSTLSLVRAGLIGFDVIGLRPYDGFARLFARADERRRGPLAS